MQAREVMSSPVVSLRPEMLLKEAAEVLATRRVSGAPVVDHLEHLVGIISEADIVRRMAPAEEHRSLLRLFLGPRHPGESQGFRVEDLMTTEVVTAAPDTAVREIAHLMTAHDVNRIPIVDGHRIVGIVTRADLMRALTRDDAAITEDIRSRLARDLWIDTSTVDIRTDRGAVTITGEVESYTDAKLTAQWAQGTEGVVAVDAGGLRYRFDDRRVMEPKRPDPSEPGPRWP